MAKITSSKAAELTGISRDHINLLIRTGVLPAKKLDPDVRNSPFMINERDLKLLENRKKRTGKKPARCEPCNHQLKKECATCGRKICIRDYHKTITGLPAVSCKDCQNAAIVRRRNQLK